MKNYVAENMSTTSITTVKCGLKVLSNGSESIIFVFLGISTVNDNHEWNTAFILLTIFFCSLYRVLGRHHSIKCIVVRIDVLTDFEMQES